MAVSTRYTNVTDTQPDTARRHRPRLCAARRAAKTEELLSFLFGSITSIYSREHWTVTVECALVLIQCVSKNVPSLTGYSFNTHPPFFLQCLAHIIGGDWQIGRRYNFLKYLALTYFIMLLSEMTEMMRYLRHCYSVTGALCKHGFSVDDKVLIKNLYQFSGTLVQTVIKTLSLALKTMIT